MMDPRMPNPWTDTEPALGVRTAASSIWPDRLLHVPTMKSHRNNGQNVYDNTLEPRYNVLSYTWGRFCDNSADAEDQHVTIHGVNWRIPSIQNSHFTPAQFQCAMENATRGVQKKPCEWLWVDVACIPQQQEGEGDDSIRLRMQEIGRQVGIFARAQESFVWLSTLDKTQIHQPGQPHVRVEALQNYTIPLLVPNGGADLELAANILNNLDRESRMYAKWLKLIIEEPWFRSLWTLQEMFLRPDAWILFRDGLLHKNEYQGIIASNPFPASRLEGVERTEAMTSNTSGIWCLSDFKHEILRLDSFVNSNPLPWPTWDTMRGIENQLQLAGLLQNVPSVTEIRQRLDTRLRLMRQHGMDAMHISFANAAYSAANHRRVTNLLDNIYGITQAYGISCDPDPPGTSDTEKLSALEDDFGSRLVSQYPVLSQLFIHTQQPRRSWLITKGCRVDHWWESFEANSKTRIINLTEAFRIRNEDTAGPYVEFKGLAWDLEPFIRVGSLHMLIRMSPFGDPLFYNGMLLDQHARTVIGETTDYFPSCDSMAEAATQLSQHYSAKGPWSLRVASLGCSFVDSLPEVNHVGLLLAPSWTENRALEGDIEPEFWIRIGLMRWVEDYQRSDLGKKHPKLPPQHEFQCMIR